ncbi:MAG: ABC transporter ATP-binding protein/permease [Clostridia bacterium]|nr:ABC transporter ATP-binding protein/permease [Clostridia bacterium]
MLKLEDIKKTYDLGDTKVEALKGISISFRDNEFVSILGPSGCGKTTLLNIIGGLDKYTSGNLIIDGKGTKEFNDGDWDTYRNHKIGFVFQGYNLIPHINVLENVAMALSLNGISKEERKQRAVEALEKVGLKDQIKKMPNQLSGGQMQRVAIARAIVNNPSIILADEPTGALDSKTSKQVLEILKKISADKLIIMVTHNASLAKKYSTRIIKFLDGKLKSDNMPYDDTEQENLAKNEQKEEKNDQKLENIDKKVTKNKEKKSAMSFFTALYLSLKNLLTKKGRTILTSFAGSIGIIGVALVLAISNGFNNYINTVQNDTLSAYPITIATATIDFDAIESNAFYTDSGEEKLSDAVTVSGDITDYFKYGHYNCLNDNFINYVKDFETDYYKNNDNPNIAHIEYNYYAPTKFLIKQANNKVGLEQTKNSINLFSTDGGGNLFFPSIKDEEYIFEQYDLVYTADNYDPNDIYGLTLVLRGGNKISNSILTTLGVPAAMQANTKYAPVKFKDICDKVEIKLLYNNDYYIYDSGNDKFDTIDITDGNLLKTMFDSDQYQTLKITRIIAPKDNSNTALFSQGVMYSNALQEQYLQNCKTSQIAQKQAERKIAEADSGNYHFYDPLQIDISASAYMYANMLGGFDFSETNNIKAFLNFFYRTELSTEEAYEIGVQQIGVSSMPQSIVFYPVNFDGKNEVNKMISDYNEGVSDVYSIVATDNSSFLTKVLSAMINGISIVLIAFASISLVVSSIMIGIITYVSVIERTREIGILRSLGARKKDISHIFSAETIIIGVLSGLIGVAITYLLCPLISLIVANSAGINNVAVLNPLHALILVGISTLLTLTSGTIPSRIASRKDPVECLRSE